LPTLSEVLALSESTLPNSSDKVDWTGVKQNCDNITTLVDSTHKNAVERVKAEVEWSGAIAATEQLLLQSIDAEVLTVNGSLPPAQGLVVAGPVPVLSNQTLISNLPTWLFTVESSHKAGIPFHLPPATATLKADSLLAAQIPPNAGSVLPLLAEDPLSNEQFCLVLTAEFSLVMVLGKTLMVCQRFCFLSSQR
jgi:hypothetical protein